MTKHGRLTGNPNIQHSPHPSILSLFFLLWWLYLPCQRYEPLEASSRTRALLANFSWVSTSNFVHSTTHIRAQWNGDGREPRDEPWHVGMLLTSETIVFVHKADIKGRSVFTTRPISRPRARIYVSGQSGHERLYHESKYHSILTSSLQQYRGYAQRELPFRI